MPVTFHFDEGIIVIEAVGIYSPEALMGALRDAVDKFAQSGRVPVMLDQRQSVSLATRSTEDLRRLATFGDQLTEFIGPRIAFVVEGILEFGLDRLASAYMDENFESNIFPDSDAARRWLLEE